MNYLIDQIVVETECNENIEPQDLSYWALLSETVLPDIMLANPAIQKRD